MKFLLINACRLNQDIVGCCIVYVLCSIGTLSEFNIFHNIIILFRSPPSALLSAFAYKCARARRNSFAKVEYVRVDHAAHQMFCNWAAKKKIFLIIQEPIRSAYAYVLFKQEIRKCKQIKVHMYLYIKKCIIKYAKYLTFVLWKKNTFFSIIQFVRTGWFQQQQQQKWQTRLHTAD